MKKWLILTILLLSANWCYAIDFDPITEVDYYEFVFFSIEEIAVQDTLSKGSVFNVSFRPPIERNFQVQSDYKGVLTGDSISVRIPNSLINYSDSTATNNIDVNLNTGYYEVRCRVFDNQGLKSVYGEGCLILIRGVPPVTIRFIIN